MFRHLAVCILLGVTCTYGQTLDRMFLDIRFQYESWDTDIKDVDLTVDGVDKAFTPEDIDRMSAGHRFHTTFLKLGADLGYHLTDCLDVELGGGLAFVNHESNHDTPGLTHELVTRKPGFYSYLASHYTIPIIEGLSATLSPDITYYFTDDVHGIGQNEDALSLDDYDLHHTMINWRGKVLFQYDLHWLSPYVGAMYHDYDEKVKYEGTTFADAFGDVYKLKRVITYRPFSHVAGILGTTVNLGAKKDLIAETAIGRIFDLRMMLRMTF